MQLHRAGRHLAHQRRVGPQQQLLAGLAPGIERAGYLGPAEGAVVEQPAVLPSEGHALGGGLVDDVHRHLGQAVHVGLPGPVVAPLDGVVEQPVNAVAVVLVVLGRIDAALGGNAVGPAGGVVVGEHLDPVTQLAQRGGGRCPGQARAHHDDVEAALVVGVHQPHGELVVGPLVVQRSGRDASVERAEHQWSSPSAAPCWSSSTMERPLSSITPACTKMGKLRLPTRMIPASPAAR